MVYLIQQRLVYRNKPINNNMKGSIVMMYTDYERANEIATALRSSGEWDFELLEELCELVGIKEEWLNSDGETFESVVYKAAEILWVDID